MRPQEDQQSLTNYNYTEPRAGEYALLVGERERNKREEGQKVLFWTSCAKCEKKGQGNRTRDTGNVSDTDRKTEISSCAWPSEDSPPKVPDEVYLPEQ